MPAYDAARFDPPAPLASVTLRNAENNIILPDVPMLIDTGADITLIPQSTVQLLEIATSTDRFYELSSFDGSRSLAAVVRLEILLLGRTFRGQFLLIDQEFGILGRNILNSVALLLDGPHLSWQEHRNR